MWPTVPGVGESRTISFFCSSIGKSISQLHIYCYWSENSARYPCLERRDSEEVGEQQVHAEVGVDRAPNIPRDHQGTFPHAALTIVMVLVISAQSWHVLVISVFCCHVLVSSAWQLSFPYDLSMTAENVLMISAQRLSCPRDFSMTAVVYHGLSITANISLWSQPNRCHVLMTSA